MNMGNLIPKSLLENIPNLYETESFKSICHIKLLHQHQFYMVHNGNQQR